MKGEQVTHVVKRGVGRPTRYDDSLVEKLTNYFDVDPHDYISHNFTTAGKSNYQIMTKSMPSIMGFCREVGITSATLHDWVDKHKEFAAAYAHARQLYEKMIVDIGIATNSTFAVFMLKCNFGWRDNEEVLQKDQGKAVRLKIVSERKDGGAKDPGEAVDWGDD